MSYEYVAPSSYRLVYVYAIPASADHVGLVKIGGATLKSSGPHTAFPPMCDALQKAARARIDQQTATAGVKYELLHCELAVRWVKNGNEKYLAPFEDHDVHNVLENSGHRHVKMSGTKAREWFKVDLETAKKAITAVKEGRVSLNSSEIGKSPPFVFREEQESAITQTLARFKKHADMLWDAKMRFGKTPTALEVVRRGGYRKTIIITHRPVVGTSWREDFQKIFPQHETPYEFVDRSSAKSGASSAADEAAKKRLLESYDKSKKHFIYFASIQDLRGSKKLGGDFLKNEAVFDMKWDLVIVDEAHEGTQTDLGRKVSEALVTKGHTRVLSLSGTPFNILSDYDDDAVFVWDYTMEQRTKLEWDAKHPGEPNPYAALPRMNILTFDLSQVLAEYAEEELEGKAFNFTEFFRTWTGVRELDGRKLPGGAKVGSFVHENDVRKFLDLLTTPSKSSRYPFATAENCDYFRHSLWMVPGVASAKALSALLHEHRIFGSFGVANVAGKGDDYEDDHYDSALELVRETIRKYPRSITLSCGKLTTGVTVPEWTAVMMIAGSVHTAASSYMQTIFRVQSPWMHDGQMKEECYVFDFAPDRTLTVLTETAQLSRKMKKDDSEAKGRAALDEFINFCSVIAIEGGEAKPYDVKEMMRRLKHVFVMKAIRNGFDDASLYNNAKLMKLGKIDLLKFKGLEGVVGRTKQTEAPNSVSVNAQGFDNEEHDKIGEEEKKQKKPPTPEQLQHRLELQQAKNARSILRAISIRMPLLIYGADVPFDERIGIRKFVTLVDDASWIEFMPKGVTKKIFHDFIEYYDPDVFEAAGVEIRRLAKTAEKLAPGRRAQQIARIFGYFKNPDKETVLTPWRVVNMHLSDTLGGWCFFPEEGMRSRATGRAVVPRPPGSDEPLDDPRFVDRGDVTRRVFSPTSRILEINSKSGLYPLYVAYSLYRARCGEIAEEDIAPIARAKKWREVLCDNVFVICKTTMAASITRRTLAGYTTARVNAICWNGDLVETLKTNPSTFTNAITKGIFWGKEDKEMKFDAVVGNPPYQCNIGDADGGNASLGKQLFPWFILATLKLNARLVSMITPSRWFTADAQDKSFIKLREALKSNRGFRAIYHYAKSKQLFTSEEIAGGVNYFLNDSEYDGDTSFHEIYENRESVTLRPLFEPGLDIIISMNSLVKIIHKIADRDDFVSLMTMTQGRNAFGIVGKSSELERITKSKPFNDAIEVRCAHEEIRYAKKNAITKNFELMMKWKVLISKGNGGAGILGDDKPVAILGKPYLSKPGTVCTDSLIPIGGFGSKKEAENLCLYLKTKFVRFVVGILKTSQNIYQTVYRFVPVQDFTEPWTDEKLYKKYGITKDEQAFIESMIKPME